MTDRLPLAQHTKASLDQLYADLERARADIASCNAQQWPQRLARAEAANTRVTALYEQWVKAGPPPLGVLLARWWDARLVELHNAIRPAAEEQRLAHSGVDTPGCDCGHDGMGVSWHGDDCPWRRSILEGAKAPAVPAVPECGPACTEQHAYDWTCEQFAGVDDSGPADLAGYLAPEPGIGCLAATTPSQRPGLRDDIAKAARTVPLRLGPNAAAMAQRGEPIILNMGEADDLADAVLTLLYREWPWLRAAAEDAVPPAAT